MFMTTLWHLFANGWRAADGKTAMQRRELRMAAQRAVVVKGF